VREAKFQLELIKKLKEKLPGCFVLKNDSSYIQGVPDLIVLWEDRWAMLEVKMDALSSVQPNQQHYIRMFDEMSFAAFINPDNEEDVLYALQRSFGARR